MLSLSLLGKAKHQQTSPNFSDIHQKKDWEEKSDWKLTLETSAGPKDTMSKEAIINSQKVSGGT
jgi:hypothetical protein